MDGTPRGTPLRRLAALVVLAAATSATAQAQSLAVDIAADTSFSRSYAWSLDKSVTPEFSDRFVGESQELGYVLQVTRGEAQDSAFRVFGQATIDNPSSEPATISSITILLGASLVTHDCAAGVLAAGARLDCAFDVEVSSSDPQTLSIDVQTSGTVAGASASTAVDFGEPQVSNGTVTVTDSNLPGEELVFTDSGTHAYSLSGQCLSGNSVVIDNTATIVETGASDTERARISCHVLRMDRRANAVTGAHWNWDISKTHAESLPLMLFAGQTYDVDYTITATATADDSGSSGVVSGHVSIANTHPLVDAQLVSVGATINGHVEAVVDCPSLVIPDAEYDADSNVVHGMLVCPFTATMPEGETPSTITGTVVQQLFAYAADGSATPAGTKTYTGTSGVTVGGSGEETDECVAISDLYLGVDHDLGEFCAADSPVVLTFTGAIEVTAESACEFEVPNLASLLTNDTGATDQDGTVVSVARTDCDGGCTRTQGYWKTHSIYGPAPYDDTWAQIGEDTVFFQATAGDAQLSWYEVMWTAPKGNAYFNLAHQYIAASLNMLAGASASEQVLDAMEEATDLFETWSSDQIGALRGNQSPRPQFIELAGVLDMYNNGQGGLGPEHCSEDDSSD